MIIFASANKITTNQKPETMKIEFGKDSIAVIYNNSNPDGKRAIKEELGDKFSEILPVTERIKTFEDARAELGEGHEAVRAYVDLYWKLDETGKDILAYLKLRIITAALNEGWKPDFTEGEHRWFPWFQIYSEEQINKMGQDEKASLLPWCCTGSEGVMCGVSFADSDDSCAPVSTRLTLKSEELAKYAGTQFIEIYADFSFSTTNKPTE